MEKCSSQYVSCHIALTESSERGRPVLRYFLPFIQGKTPCYKEILYASRMGLPFSVLLLWEHPHRFQGDCFHGNFVLSQADNADYPIPSLFSKIRLITS